MPAEVVKHWGGLGVRQISNNVLGSAEFDPLNPRIFYYLL